MAALPGRLGEYELLAVALPLRPVRFNRSKTACS